MSYISRTFYLYLSDKCVYSCSSSFFRPDSEVTRQQELYCHIFFSVRSFVSTEIEILFFPSLSHYYLSVFTRKRFSGKIKTVQRSFNLFLFSIEAITI